MGGHPVGSCGGKLRNSYGCACRSAAHWSAESDIYLPAPRTPVKMPSHTSVEQTWRSQSGPREDREFTRFEARVPSEIETVDLVLSSPLVSECESALDEVSRLDAEYGAHLAPLSGMMLRTEAIASSKIENEHASIEDYIRALHGNKSNRSALAMAHATAAIDHLLDNGINQESVLESHRKLMADAGLEAMYAGTYRTVQNWIGGSDHSPRGALYVPPPPNQVRDLMEDVIRFSRREDASVIAQASVMHAQFESIHPFTDGNGRIGRAMVSSLLRQRGYTRHTTIPIAAALAPRRHDYFETLEAYRDGDAEPIIRLMAQSVKVSAHQARVSAHRLSQMPDEWSARAGNPRRNSAPGRIIRQLSESPILSSEYLGGTLGISESASHRGLARLTEAGVVREITGRKRNRVWVASDVTDELESLESRIGEQMRSFEM